MVQHLKQALIIPDLHVPFSDKKYLKLIDKIITILKPNYLVQMGDLVDFFQISKFSKDPERRSTVFEDLMEARQILDRWEKLMPNESQFHLLSGNHEARLSLFVNSKCPELNKMIRSIPDVYGLTVRNKFGKHHWHWHELNAWDSCKIGDVVFHHGNYYNVHTAGTNLVKYPCKFVQAHNHRMLLAFGNPDKWSATVAHGIDMSQVDYLRNPVDWRQGFSVVTFIDGKGSIELIEVKDGSCIFRGQMIKT